MLNNSRLIIRIMFIVELHNVDKYDWCKFRNQTARIEANVLLILRHPSYKIYWNPNGTSVKRLENTEQRWTWLRDSERLTATASLILLENRTHTTAVGSLTAHLEIEQESSEKVWRYYSNQVHCWTSSWSVKYLHCQSCLNSKAMIDANALLIQRPHLRLHRKVKPQWNDWRT